MLAHKHVVAAPAPVIVPVYDPVSGLAFNTLTAAGGIRSRHVDEAIAEITAANAALGSSLSPFMVANLWAPPDQATGILQYDPNRFAEPTPDQQQALRLTDEQVAQILGNQVQQDYFDANVYMAGDKTGHPSDGYRGEAGSPHAFQPFKTITQDIFGVIVTKTPLDQAIANKLPNASLLDATEPDSFGRVFYIRKAFLPDHVILDPWWDGRTGIALARWYRGLARAGGLDVSAEPTP